MISGSISKEHFHILVSCMSKLSVFKLVQLLEEKTSRTLQMKFKDLKSRDL
ncbi:MAG TPA: hypothetical protein DHU33_02170 [Firmicutes bacterium]|nr:hypothetical protein [Bacillota bacterium]